ASQSGRDGRGQLFTLPGSAVEQSPAGKLGGFAGVGPGLVTPGMAGTVRGHPTWGRYAINGRTRGRAPARTASSLAHGDGAGVGSGSVAEVSSEQRPVTSD